MDPGRFAVTSGKDMPDELGAIGRMNRVPLWARALLAVVGFNGLYLAKAALQGSLGGSTLVILGVLDLLGFGIVYLSYRSYRRERHEQSTTRKQRPRSTDQRGRPHSP